MPTLVAIGYRDETTAAVAGEEVLRLSAWLGVPPDDVAVVAMEAGHLYRVTTGVSAGSRGSVFWPALFGALVLEPASEPAGEAIHALVRVRGLAAPIESGFAEQARRLLVPGAAALFVLVDEGDAAAVLEAVERYGGRPVLTSPAPELPGSAA